jgi:hypothetical protein
MIQAIYPIGNCQDAKEGSSYLQSRQHPLHIADVDNGLFARQYAVRADAHKTVLEHPRRKEGLQLPDDNPGIPVAFEGAGVDQDRLKNHGHNSYPTAKIRGSIQGRYASAKLLVPESPFSR